MVGNCQNNAVEGAGRDDCCKSATVRSCHRQGEQYLACSWGGQILKAPLSLRARADHERDEAQDCFVGCHGVSAFNASPKVIEAMKKPRAFVVAVALAGVSAINVGAIENEIAVRAQFEKAISRLGSVRERDRSTAIVVTDEFKPLLQTVSSESLLGFLKAEFPHEEVRDRGKYAIMFEIILSKLKYSSNMMLINDYIRIVFEFDESRSAIVTVFVILLNPTE